MSYSSCLIRFTRVWWTCFHASQSEDSQRTLKKYSSVVLERAWENKFSQAGEAAIDLGVQAIDENVELFQIIWRNYFHLKNRPSCSTHSYNLPSTVVACADLMYPSPLV